VEVRDGRVVNYRGDYEAYLYSINQEIDTNEIKAHKMNTAEQQQAARRASAEPGKRSKTSKPDAPRDERSVRKEVAALEKTIARLEGQKASTDQQLLAATDPAEALRLHQELVSLKGELEAAEERWLRLQS
jgi:ATP-binding cassette subfamily F protein 3